jgi:hypothetical protein
MNRKEGGKEGEAREREECTPPLPPPPPSHWATSSSSPPPKPAAPACPLVPNKGRFLPSGVEMKKWRGKRERLSISKGATSGDETAMSVLSTQMGKLKSVENITSPMEGVVFVYKGNAYKFTGSFAAANQILGLFKYGRKGTKL